MKKNFFIILILNIALFSLGANSFMFLTRHWQFLFLILPIMCAITVTAGFFALETKQVHLKISFHGNVLFVICFASTLISIVYHVVLGIKLIPNDWQTFLWSFLICYFFQASLFCSGLCCIYLTSVQLGIKRRVIMAICGMIPFINLIVLARMIFTVHEEIWFEIYREKLDEQRKHLEICKTKYPIILIHGVFFRDFKHINYWGRIPKALEANGATVYYSDHQSASAVAYSANELRQKILKIVKETGCEKVNIIAHSKGGLDSRYAIANLELAPYVASLTTINTPHRGCHFADHLLTKLPKFVVKRIEKTYNAAFRKLGDHDPDFMSAVKDLTAFACSKRNREIGDLPDGIFCQSVGSLVNRATSGKFPTNLSYYLAKKYDGPGDGVVSEYSFKWGQEYICLTTTGRRGISHADVTDLNRENIKDFDVREFYIGLVSTLREKGL